jgi:hypothetical protein
VWAKDGTHFGWVSAPDLCRNVKIALGLTYDIPTTTAAYWLQQEKIAYHACVEHPKTATPTHLPLIKRPINGLASLLLDWEDDKKLEEELCKAAEGDVHHNSMFTPDMRKKLKDDCNKLIGEVGFRPSLVLSMASCIYSELMGPDIPAWSPSLSWVYAFMHGDLNCSFRRATSSRPNFDTDAATDALHLRNCQNIAIKRADGWEDWQFMTTDQFGSHLYPQHRGVWTKRGTVDVYTENFEDKRQYTGNICGNGAGEVRFQWNE